MLKRGKRLIFLCFFAFFIYNENGTILDKWSENDGNKRRTCPQAGLAED
ncbi:hypothetical protein TGS27_1693 [Geobacillus stearothermophilus]|uniref:Uncharacterized protein n=1 Tax=Geobacillus stearothermophilus TaxID=1422 RepID=A0ABQ7HEX6_GEOSE|nr:hypothetical protein GS8_2855 [Geobacillus stearothermophilus]OAO81219.1 hypothetical protein TGS27_1693 [Geobacillus stearothermophilus]